MIKDLFQGIKTDYILDFKGFSITCAYTSFNLSAQDQGFPVMNVCSSAHILHPIKCCLSSSVLFASFLSEDAGTESPGTSDTGEPRSKLPESLLPSYIFHFPFTDS